MSYVFDREDGSLVWSPSLRAGELFVSTAESLSKITRTPTGFEVQAADWYKIHAEQFSKFVFAVVSYSWHNLTLRELVRGFVSISIVLLEKLGKESEAGRLAGSTGMGDEPLLGTLRHTISQL